MSIHVRRFASAALLLPLCAACSRRSSPAEAALCRASVFIPYPTFSLQAPESSEISAVVAPLPPGDCPREVVWESSDDGVAHVLPQPGNRAEVRGVSEGRATLSAVYRGADVTRDGVEVVVTRPPTF